MNRLNILVVAACFLLIYASKVQAEVHTDTAIDMGISANEKTTESESELFSNMPDLVEVKIRHGDSLYDLARWSNTQIDIVESLNGVDTNDQLVVGGGLLLPMTKVEHKAFKAKRERFETQRRVRFLKRNGPLRRLKSHRVKQGQTVWRIARDHGRLPVWLVQSYNPDVNLNRVRVGQVILIPIIGDEAENADETTGDFTDDNYLDSSAIDEEEGC